MDIDQIRSLCLSFPATSEDIKWDNDLVFSVGGKMFCVVALDPPFSCSFKVKDEEFEELSSMEGFKPAPYMARAKWVQISKSTAWNCNQWEAYIKGSYELVAAKLTKKQRQELGLL